MAKWSERLKWWNRKDAPEEQVVRKVVSGTHRAGSVTCPRCRRQVADSPRGRDAHRLGCVRIPEHRPKGWGERAR